MLVSESRGTACIILHRDGEKALITSNALTIFDGSLADAKENLKNLSL